MRKVICFTAIVALLALSATTSSMAYKERNYPLQAQLAGRNVCFSDGTASFGRGGVYTYTPKDGRPTMNGRWQAAGPDVVKESGGGWIRIDTYRVHGSNVTNINPRNETNEGKFC